MEAVHKEKAEKLREKTIADQFEARRSKNKAARERKATRREERLLSVSVGKISGKGGSRVWQSINTRQEQVLHVGLS